MKPLSCALSWRAPAVACFVLGQIGVTWAQSGTPVQQARDAAAQSSPAALAAAQPAAAPAFDVLEFAVEGNTVLSDEQIERAVMPYLGEGRNFAAVESARAALEKAYQDAGYLTVFVDVPEQEVSQGVVTLRVLEGRVERLSVSGSRYFDQGYIRSRVPELAEGKVPNFNVVQAQLADVNRTDDRRVQPVLRPGREPNSAEVELKVTDQLPVHGTVELNNNHGQYNKPWRLMASARYDNLFQRDHSLQLMAMTAPANPSESRALGLTYTVPMSGGDSWVASALWSDSQLEALGAAQILGRGTVIGLKHQWALPSTPSSSHALELGVDYKNMKERTLVGSDQLSTPLRYMPFTLSYMGSWVQEDGAVTTWNPMLVFGVASVLQRDIDCGFGMEDQFACKREGADGGFAYLRFDVRHNQPVGRWRVDGRVAGQVATQALVGGEQYALGGADSVRGYLSAEVVGDHGLMASVQVSSPNLVPGERAGAAEAGWLPAWLQEAQLYAFLDAGRVQIINPSAAQSPRQSLGAMGAGIKLRAAKSWTLQTDVARAFKSASVTHSGDKRVHVRLSSDF
jgi:hemolysin activation/secretion protein